MQRTFHVVVIPQREGGFYVDCPALEGCHSQGETYEEALANIREAIELVLEDMEGSGEPVSDPIPMPSIAEVRIAV